MSTIVRIKRSATSGDPLILGAGELAYSGLTFNGSNGGDRLYIGLGTETGGNAANHYVIGGKYFTDMLDQTPGTLTASSAIVVDANKAINEFFVGSLELTGNTISSTTTNADIVLSPNGTGVVDVSNSRIVGVADPVDASDAATRNYVDSKISGLTWKDAANLLSNTNIALSGTTGTLVIDSHAALTSAQDGYRLLLVNQSTVSENGIYVYNDDGSNYTLTRALDGDTYQELIGAAIFILEGTAYRNTGWVQSDHYITSFSGQQWVQFSGSGTYSGGNGINITGNTVSVKLSSTGGLDFTGTEIELNPTVAGAGLTITSGVIDVVGTTNRIIANANSIDISALYAGQTSITTLGVVGTGTWNADTIVVSYGGTGLTTATARGVLYGNGTSALGVTSAAAIDGSFLRSDSTGNPYFSNVVDGGTY